VPVDRAKKRGGGPFYVNNLSHLLRGGWDIYRVRRKYGIDGARADLLLAGSVDTKWYRRWEGGRGRHNRPYVLSSTNAVPQSLSLAPTPNRPIPKPYMIYSLTPLPRHLAPVVVHPATMVTDSIGVF
jgi:hypothetical protein